MQPNGEGYQYGFPVGGGTSGGGIGAAGWGGGIASGVLQGIAAYNAFSLQAPSTPNWSSLAKVQGNPLYTNINPDLAVQLGSFARDLEKSWNALKALSGQNPLETEQALSKALRNGTIKDAIVHSVVNTIVKYATGDKFQRDVVIGSTASQALQLLSFPEEDVLQPGELEELPNVAKNGETSATAYGRAMHKAYKAGMADGVRTFKEFNRINGIRPDFVDFNTRTIYELKPNNLRAIKQGEAQLAKYKDIFQKFYKGTPWKTVLDIY